MYTRNGQMVPLAVLLKRELSNEKVEKPEIVNSQASQSKKGEDLTLLKTECQRIPGDGTTTFSVFALFDGHNGSAAAVYAKENLLNNILSAIPSDLTRDEWLAALPRALVAGFVKTDKDFQEKAQTSGTTVTFVIIDGWVVTVASVGDSRCFLESAEGTIYSLSADHRLEVNEEERERITASGGEVGRLNAGGGAEIGPLRCWPGGLCLSRSIGDMDVGEFIVPVPYVKQVKDENTYARSLKTISKRRVWFTREAICKCLNKQGCEEKELSYSTNCTCTSATFKVVPKLTNAGGRLIISSDGVWDALTSEMAVDCCRGMPADAAATQIVKEAIKPKGIRDDTTCIVVDIIPPVEKLSPVPAQPKKQGKGMFKSMFRRKSNDSSSHSDKEYAEPDLVEELFEEGSAMLAHRLDSEYPLCNMFKLFVCAVCQVEMKPGEGISVHAGSSHLARSRPWDGPFLCQSCQLKKDAMEGKRPSGARAAESDDDAL